MDQTRWSTFLKYKHLVTYNNCFHVFERKRNTYGINKENMKNVPQKTQKTKQAHFQQILIVSNGNQRTESTVRRWHNVAYYMFDNYCRQKPAASIAYMC